VERSDSTLGPILIALAVGAMLVIAFQAATGLDRLSRFWTDPDEISDVMQTTSAIFTDAFIEAGLRPQGLDPDDPLLAQRTIVISEGMNESVARRVVESLLYLDHQDPTQPIDLYIYTTGGWYDSAFAIADTILAIDAPVNTIALGGCYSAGAIVLVAGTGTRSAHPNAILSVHANLDHDSTEYTHERYNEARMEAHFRRFAKLPEAWYPLSGEPEHYYFDPTEAIEIGVIDRIATE